MRSRRPLFSPVCSCNVVVVALAYKSSGHLKASLSLSLSLQSRLAPATEAAT